MNTPSEPTPRVAWSGVLAAVSGLAGGWIAVGSAGLLGHPLRHALTWLALLGVVVAVGRNVRRPLALSVPILVAGGLLAIVMTSSTLVPVNVAAVAAFLAAVVLAQDSKNRDLLLVVAEATLLLAWLCLCRTAVPMAWQAADRAGAGLGGAVGAVLGRPLWLGATFAGVDVLVPMLYLAAVVPLRFGDAAGGARKLRRVAWSVALVLAGQVLYLSGLAYAADVIAGLPTAQPPEEFASYRGPPRVSFVDFVRHVAPWNLPLAAVVIQTSIAGAILATASKAMNPADGVDRRYRRAWPHRLHAAIVVLLAVAAPLLVAPSAQPRSLHGKKIVLYEKGYLNWLRPQHGDYGRWAVGMYGMLPDFLQSLGAQVRISPDLSAEDLRGADALVLIYPDQPWQKGRRERIWDFVRRGGGLLVLGEHTTRQPDGGSRFNDILEPTAMRVGFDSATFAVGGWLQSYEPLWHPTSCGLHDLENDFGVVIGASVDARPPARPLLAGRWGWADPGDPANEAAMMGNGRYDAGEKLGDLLLAAEQSFGRGKVIVFGDTSSLSNGINIGCHPYVSRLFAYLADGAVGPVASWRQWVALAAAAVAAGLVAFRPGATACGLAAAAMALVLIAATARSHRAGEVLPDGGRWSPVKLAYIDASHLERYSRESWRDDGTMGLCLALMRDGYLTLTLPELTAARLQRARLLISIAPARPFNRRERETVLQFIREGGIFISTVGYQDWGPTRELLTELGFRVGAVAWHGADPIGGPEPLGHFKAPYFDGGDYLAYVRYHAAWPIFCDDPEALNVSYYPDDKPLIVVRRYGHGLAAVIGDTCFAMNKNLELESGEPIEGLRENADFWRWFLALLGEGESWYPQPQP